jgi:uncharacterized protein YyaL (SSP411 family)
MLTHPTPQLPSLQDADSLDPSTSKTAEGAFYVWTAGELSAALGGGTRAALVSEVYGVKPGGNADLSPRSDPHQEFTGKNVLMQVRQMGPLLQLTHTLVPS